MQQRINSLRTAVEGLEGSNLTIAQQLDQYDTLLRELQKRKYVRGISLANKPPKSPFNHHLATIIANLFLRPFNLAVLALFCSLTSISLFLTLPKMIFNHRRTDFIDLKRTEQR